MIDSLIHTNREKGLNGTHIAAMVALALCIAEYMELKNSVRSTKEITGA